MVSAAHLILERGIFSKDPNFTCAYPDPNNHGTPLAIGITFRMLMIYITIAATGVCTISALFLIWKHLHRYTKPKEQRQIIRIIFYNVFNCIIALLCVIFYQASIYIGVVEGIYQAFCISAMFLLFVEYTVPDEASRPQFFMNLVRYDKKKKVIPGSSLKWFNIVWIQAMQYPFTKALFAAIECITQATGTYCTNSLSPRYARIWLMLIDYFVISAAVKAVFQYYGQLKGQMDKKHMVTWKLITFKGIVLFLLVQDLIFGLLNGKTFKPSPQYTYDDIYYGIPHMMTALEAMLFSFAYHYAWRSREYDVSELAAAGQQVTRMSTGRAILDAINLMDIVKATIWAIRLLLNSDLRNGHVWTGTVEATKMGDSGAPPKRQKTWELQNRAYEPYSHSATQPLRKPSPTGDYEEEELGVVRPPAGPPPSYHHPPSPYAEGGREADLTEPAPLLTHDYNAHGYPGGYAEVGGRSRDPSPSGAGTTRPRDMV